MQSGEFIDAQGDVVDHASRKLAGVKVLADGHFAFSTSDGVFWAGGSGTCEGDAAHYVEMSLMASYPLEGDGSDEFRYTLEGRPPRRARGLAAGAARLQCRAVEWDASTSPASTGLLVAGLCGEPGVVQCLCKAFGRL